MLAGLNTAPSAKSYSEQLEDTFQWCGGTYSRHDLGSALELMLSHDALLDPQTNLFPQQYEDPWDPTSWEVFDGDALCVLQYLHACGTGPQVVTSASLHDHSGSCKQHAPVSFHEPHQFSAEPIVAHNSNLDACMTRSRLVKSSQCFQGGSVTQNPCKSSSAIIAMHAG